LRADCSEVASYHAVWRATTAEDFGPAPSGERTPARIANLVTPKHARRASRRQHGVRSGLFLQPTTPPPPMSSLGQVLPSRPPDRMSAAEGEAPKTAGKRTSTILTAGIRPVADVARNWLGRLGMARSRTGRWQVARSPSSGSQHWCASAIRSGFP
jgi:hypothetical protein